MAVTAPGAGTPTGNVTVSDGAGTTCVAAASAGSCNLTFTTTGTPNLTATYAGDGNFLTSASSSTGHTVDAFGPATKYVVTVSTATPAAGADVTITAQLTDAFGNAVPTSGVIVTWSSTNGGVFSAPTSTTNASGVATVTFTTDPGVGVQHVVTATDGASRTGDSPTITTQ